MGAEDHAGARMRSPGGQATAGQARELPEERRGRPGLAHRVADRDRRARSGRGRDRRGLGGRRPIRQRGVRRGSEASGHPGRQPVAHLFGEGHRGPRQGRRGRPGQARRRLRRSQSRGWWTGSSTRRGCRAPRWRRCPRRRPSMPGPPTCCAAGDPDVQDAQWCGRWLPEALALLGTYARRRITRAAASRATTRPGTTSPVRAPRALGRTPAAGSPCAPQGRT